MHSFNMAVFERYKDVVKELYTEPMEKLLESFLLEETIQTRFCNNSEKEKSPATSISSSMKAPKAPQIPTKSKNIRSFF